MENLGSLAGSATFNSSVKRRTFKAVIEYLSNAVLNTGVEFLERSLVKLSFAPISSSFPAVRLKL